MVLLIFSKFVFKIIVPSCSLYTLSKSHSDNVVFPIPALPSIIIYLFFLNSSKDLFEKLEIGKSQVYYLKENGVTTLINTSNNLENFYSDFRKKDRVYDIINEYDSLLNYEGKNKIDYLILTSTKKGEIGFAETLVGKGIIKKVVILDIHKEKFNDLINLAKFKNIDVLVLKENNELIKSIYYYNKIIKIKDIEIEVVD